MRPHEKLEVWQTAVELVVSVYKQAESFPKEEKFGLTSQIRRAAVSVPANILRELVVTPPENSLTFFQTPRVQQANWLPNFSSHSAWVTLIKTRMVECARSLTALDE